jgi:cytochrome c oxidase subunit 3
MSAEARILHEQFDDIEQQRQASNMGMWVFLATEVMLFGGLFLGYTAYRYTFSQVFQTASGETEFGIATANTAVLLCSSLTMALAVHAVRINRRRMLVGMLLLTALLGAVFLGLKGLEYYLDYTKNEVPGALFHWAHPHPEQAQLFFLFYFILTGLHAVHLTAGVTIVCIMALLAWRGKFTSENDTPIEVTGLYWHLIDVVWVFLYPMFYLSGRHG